MEIKQQLAVFFLLVMLAGCISTGPVCQSPYIEYKKGDCCLDTNDNKICDKEETITTTVVLTTTTIPECVLSLCDCKCHVKGTTIEEETGKVCGINCREYNKVVGCKLENENCVEIYLTTTTSTTTSTITTTTPSTTKASTTTKATTTTIACYKNSDCGIDGNATSEYFCKEGNVAIEKITYTCMNVGMPNSYCKDDWVTTIKDICKSNERCVEGKSSCQSINCNYGSSCPNHPKGCKSLSIGSGGYSPEYLGYSYKIDHLTYDSNGCVSAVFLVVKKPDGTTVSATAPKGGYGVMDDTEIGFSSASETSGVAKATIWVYDTTVEQITCYSNSDCGEDTFMGYYCEDWSSGYGVYEHWSRYMCLHPGTITSQCVGPQEVGDESNPVDICSTDEKCVDGSSVCIPK